MAKRKAGAEEEMTGLEIFLIAVIIILLVVWVFDMWIIEKYKNLVKDLIKQKQDVTK